jgi:truncated hemoglobin YjbI
VKGLRTLLLAKRKLSEEEFKTWLKSYETAKGIIGQKKAEAIINC